MSWLSPRAVRRHHRPAKPLAALRLTHLEPRVNPTNVLQYHVDNYSDGVNNSETILTRALLTAPVTQPHFGLVAQVPVTGEVYAEPLVETGVNITTGSNQGTHTIVFVATEADQLYAVADDPGGTPTIVWHRSFLTPGGTDPAGTIYNTGDLLAGATSVTPVPYTDVTPNGDITPEIGTVSTPVIDAATATLYVTTKTKENVSGTFHYVQRLYAINIQNGTDQMAPFLLGDTTNSGSTFVNYASEGSNSGNATSQIWVYGSGSGTNDRVVDPYYGTGKNVVQFNAMRQMNRPALIIANGSIIIAWASHGDNTPYHGWVASISKYDPSNLANSLKLNGVMNTTPNGTEGGIWMAGDPVTFDGSYFYFETGNGTFDGSDGTTSNVTDPMGAPGPVTGLDANGFPVSGNYGDAFVKLGLDPTTTPQTQNINGWGFKVVDYFTPIAQAYYNNNDLDQGSAGIALVPDYVVGGPANQFASAAHPKLLVGSGKDGIIYLLDRSTNQTFSGTGYNGSMGGFANHSPSGATFGNATVQVTGTAELIRSYDTPAFFNGQMYYVDSFGNGTSNGQAKAFTFANAAFTTTPASMSTDFYAFTGSTPFISANNGSNGIVWDVERNSNQLRAYSSDSYATELYNSASAAGGRDNLGPAVKFQVVTVANGRVYVGAGNTGSDYLASNPAGSKQNGDMLDIYGVVPGITNAPNAPSGTLAQPASPTEIHVTWTDNSVNPNFATGFFVERSTDGGMTWTQVGNVTTAQYIDTAVTAGTTYSYRVRAYNGIGNSGYSNVSSASTPAAGAHTIDYSAGFTIANTTPGASQGGLAFNGTTQANMIVTTPGAYLRLTSGSTNQTRSAYWTYPNDPTGHAGKMYINSFTTTYTYMTPAGGADGMTFVIQNDSRGLTALGGGGGSLGYSSANQITPSVAVAINIYTGHPLGTEILTNGNNDMAYSETNIITNSANNPITMTVSYSAGVLYVTEQQTRSGTLFTDTKSMAVNIPALLGTDYAYVGFTGATGGVSSTQYVENWTFDQGVAPAAPTGLQATITGYQGTGATAVPLGANLTWNAVTDTPAAGGTISYKILRSVAGGPYVQIGTSNNTNFSDSGLQTGTAYSYEVAATDTYSDSIPSAAASFTTPTVPAPPTNSAVDSVTTTSISMHWQDNSNNEDGFVILRNAGGAGFQFYQNLPPDTNPSPSTVTFTDTGLTPGTTYDYHIESYNKAGFSDFAGASTTTVTNAPTNLQANAANAAVNLTWTAPTGAASYNIYRGTVSGGPYSQIGTSNNANFTDSSVAYNTTYYYRVTAVDAGGESAQSGEASQFFAPPPRLAATTPVVVNDGSAQRSELRSITITFSGPVTFAGGNAANAFLLQQLNDLNTHFATPVTVNNLQAAVSANGSGQTVVTLTFTTTGNAASVVDPISTMGNANSVAGPSLADGRYQLTIMGSQVFGSNGVALDGAGSGTAGSNYVSPTDTFGGTGLHLYRIFGDVNGDGTDDATDVGQLKSTFNRNNTDPLYLSYLDADNSGAVDAQDVGQFKSRFNHNVFI